MTNPQVASRDLSLLAPKFRAAVEAAIADCAAKGFPVKVAEALRSQERQAWLYAQGRTRSGPRVTNAPTNLTSWHGYGLAVDVIHETLGYEPHGKNGAANEAWFEGVGHIFEKHGLAWGGRWSHPDTPHMQWGGMPASPQANHKALKQQMSNAAVWRAVGAADPDFHGSESAAVRTLRKGDSGPDVVALRQSLARHGRSINLRVDGSFGAATEAALKAFQSAHGLVPDGIAGPATRSALAKE